MIVYRGVSVSVQFWAMLAVFSYRFRSPQTNCVWEGGSYPSEDAAIAAAERKIDGILGGYLNDGT